MYISDKARVAFLLSNGTMWKSICVKENQVFFEYVDDVKIEYVGSIESRFYNALTDVSTEIKMAPRKG